MRFITSRLLFGAPSAFCQPMVGVAYGSRAAGSAEGDPVRFDAAIGLRELVGAGAFASCYRLTNVVIGNNVRSIGPAAFEAGLDRIVPVADRDGARLQAGLAVARDQRFLHARLDAL